MAGRAAPAVLQQGSIRATNRGQEHIELIVGVNSQDRACQIRELEGDRDQQLGDRGAHGQRRLTVTPLYTTS